MLCCDKKDAHRNNEEDKKNYLSEMKTIIFQLIDDMVKNVKTIKICFIEAVYFVHIENVFGKFLCVVYSFLSTGFV